MHRRRKPTPKFASGGYTQGVLRPLKAHPVSQRSTSFRPDRGIDPYREELEDLLIVLGQLTKKAPIDVRNALISDVELIKAFPHYLEPVEAISSLFDDVKPIPYPVFILLKGKLQSLILALQSEA